VTDHTENELEKRQPSSCWSSQKKAVAIVLVACVAIVGAVVLLNRDSLSVRSDVGMAPTATAEKETATEAGPNSPPEVLSLTASTDRIAPFALCELVCEAVDPDGDELTYSWSAPHGDIYGEGPTIEWGSPVSEGLYRATVVVNDGRGGETELSTSLRVKANSEPIIREMTPGADWIVPGSPVHISCAAEDPDGDELTYEWVSDSGEFYGSGTSVIWLAPEEEGPYWITVYAHDAYGAEALRAIPISVTQGEPPLIGEFIVKGVDTEMVRPTGDAWKIFRGRTLTAECVVEEGEGPYSYDWSVERGTLTAAGKIATWEAPDTRVSANLVVDVTDAHGNTASASILVYVETCTCAFG